jgi:hypothetical protein
VILPAVIVCLQAATAHARSSGLGRRRPRSDRPTRASEAGRAYLDLQNRGWAERRGTQQLLTLYVVERWLARLSASPHVDKFIVKGGILLAAYDARRPTADLDALARSIPYDQDVIVSLVSEVAIHLLPRRAGDLATDRAPMDTVYLTVYLTAVAELISSRYQGGAAARHRWRA